MYKRTDVTDTGSWSYAQELYERGDPAFVDELRRITDAPKLGGFAARWHTDRRPAARALLLRYLTMPLNAFRHEALVKRLFKLAEQAGDDEVMAHFLVALDRSVRRVQRKRRRSRSATFTNREEANATLRRWAQEGLETNIYEWSGRFNVYGNWTEDAIFMPSGTGHWRPRGKDANGPFPLNEWALRYTAHCWLFSLPTRRYLRRRAWRYFRKLGKQDPERYRTAVTRALTLYEDADTATGLALLDNWGLIHILFHHSPALVALRTGWTVPEGHSLANVVPAPIFPAAWSAAPRTYLHLIRDARCRVVRQWAIRSVKQTDPALLSSFSTEDLFALLKSDDPEVVALAVDVLRNVPDLAALGPERLLQLLDTPNPDTMQLLGDLFVAKLPVEHVPLEVALRLARSRPVPAVRLGFTWLKAKTYANEADCRALFGLVEAEAGPLRLELVRWARGVLGASPHFQPGWVLEYLDSRHAEVREEGWQWLREDARVRDHVALWRKLLESPYDDVRLLLIADLEKRVKGDHGRIKDDARLNDELLRFLWASVLLNIHRGNRIKPLVVGQLLRRIAQRPAEAPAILPLLSVALRSLRGPEWRTGLSGVVQLIESKPDLAPVVKEMFPELVFTP
ncbi:hypothetical protein AYO44_08405 [Planctomycetaceae bacterium SCGC AG-212-F19]|nr:hypothetical protein AYO44_08405 [Planctomycetaceae bacterium SCGC AG-212-F19]